MGTRADFYTRKKTRLEVQDWIGSIAWDGYPSNFKDLLKITTEKEFRKAIELLSKREDFSSLEDGWPWPWETSATTDYAYIFDCKRRKVFVKCFDKTIRWPNMKSIQHTAFGEKSGLIIMGIKK